MFVVQMLGLSNKMKLFLLQSFMDVQFPNGQVTYVAGEGITASGFVPLFGGLLQAHGKFPGETRMSYSCKVSISNLFLSLAVMNFHRYYCVFCKTIIYANELGALPTSCPSVHVFYTGFVLSYMELHTHDHLVLFW
jgi:hypothetical protein